MFKSTNGIANLTLNITQEINNYYIYIIFYGLYKPI